MRFVVDWCLVFRKIDLTLKVPERVVQCFSAIEIANSVAEKSSFSNRYPEIEVAAHCVIASHGIGRYKFPI